MNENDHKMLVTSPPLGSYLDTIQAPCDSDVDNSSVFSAENQGGMQKNYTLE